MKKIILLLSVFVSAVSFAQNIHTPQQQTLPGILYNKNTWSNLSDFVDSSGGQFTISTGKIVCTGTGGYGKKIGINIPSAREHFKLCVKFTGLTIGSGNVGFGIGAASINPYASITVLGRTNFTTTTPSGNSGFNKIDYGYYGVYSNLAYDTSQVLASSGDAIVLTLERNVNTYYMKVRNVTTNATENDTFYSMNLIYNATPPPATNNTSLYSIYNFGGGFTIDSISLTSNDIIGGDLFISDSRGTGYGSNYYPFRWFNLIGQRVQNPVLSAGGGDRLTEILERTNELVAYKPHSVTIGPIGVNDIGSGQSLSTLETNYDSLVRLVKNTMACPLILTTPPYTTNTTIAAFAAWIRSNYPNEKIIDLWNITNFPGCFVADGVHLAPLGNTVLASALLSSGYYPYASSIYDFVSGQTGGINNQTSLQSNSNFNISGVGQAPTFRYTASGSGIDALLYNNNTTSSSASQVGLYPAAGTNINTQFNVFPKGTGTAGATIWGGDWPSSPSSSWPYLSIATDGTNWNINSNRNTGATTIQPIRIYTASNTQLVLNNDGTNALTGATTINTSLLFPASSGTNRNFKISNLNLGSDNLSTMLLSPSVGTNASPILAISPIGTGFSGIKAEILVMNTDFTADQVNYEFAGLRALGANPIVFATGQQGTGTNRPLMLAASYLSDNTTNANQILLNTNGSIQFGKYGAGSYTGTAAKWLAVDASGNLIEQNAPTSGTSASYTPALTNTTNISSSSLTQATYSQVGNIVTVTVSGSITPTASSTATTLTVALPVTTATTTQSGVGGGALALNAGGLGYVGCYASVNAAGTFQIFFYPTTTTSCNFSITIQYHTN